MSVLVLLALYQCTFYFCPFYKGLGLQKTQSETSFTVTCTKSFYSESVVLLQWLVIFFSDFFQSSAPLSDFSCLLIVVINAYLVTAQKQRAARHSAHLQTLPTDLPVPLVLSFSTYLPSQDWCLSILAIRALLFFIFAFLHD